jgi:hypothetical protein
MNQSAPTSSVSLSSPKGGEGRGEEVVRVHGEQLFGFIPLTNIPLTIPIHGEEINQVRGEARRMAPEADALPKNSTASANFG